MKLGNIGGPHKTRAIGGERSLTISLAITGVTDGWRDVKYRADQVYSFSTKAHMGPGPQTHIGPLLHK